MPLSLHLDILPSHQRALWDSLHQIPPQFTLYGGTALALRLGHRESVDFDFFSNTPFDIDALLKTIPFLQGVEIVQIAPQTLTCRAQGVLFSFFGDLKLGLCDPPDRANNGIHIASLRDIAGTKAATLPRRASAKDYIDLYTILTTSEITLSDVMLAGKIIYQNQFNPLPTLKALCYYGEPELVAVPTKIRDFLCRASESFDWEVWHAAQ